MCLVARLQDARPKAGALPGRHQPKTRTTSTTAAPRRPAAMRLADGRATLAAPTERHGRHGRDDRGGRTGRPHYDLCPDDRVSGCRLLRSGAEFISAVGRKGNRILSGREGGRGGSAANLREMPPGMPCTVVLPKREMEQTAERG